MEEVAIGIYDDLWEGRGEAKFFMKIKLLLDETTITEPITSTEQVISTTMMTTLKTFINNRSNNLLTEKSYLKYIFFYL